MKDGNRVPIPYNDDGRIEDENTVIFEIQNANSNNSVLTRDSNENRY